MYVDAFGHPADLDAIHSVARKHGVKIIADTCESLGSRYRGIPTGNGRYCE